ncbi:MAG: T9SS C-terminal target domain-containing protein [Cytophagales bacterium]|nr:MAG: T9SS C-terminal target domain-containing protein [Cytophagales bacterium]
MKKNQIILFFILSMLFVFEAKSAVFNVAAGNVTALIAAINSANANNEADIINLATNSTYTLTSVNFTSTQPNTSGNASQRGLPRILNNVTGLDLTINGNGSIIIRNSSSVKFGIFSIAGQTIINNLTIRNGDVNAQGAGIFVEFKGNLELNNCKFYDNISTLDVEGGGGAIYTKSLSILRVNNCYFENNRAVNQGGGISNLLSNLYVINSIFKNNHTTDLIGGDPCGGAIYDDGARGDNGELIIRGSTFEGNTSNGKGQGGAMFLFPYRNQSAEVTGCIFKNNSANQGGAFWHKGGGSQGIPDTEYPLTAGIENTTLLFNSCVFDGNTALTASGGALWISDCIINEIHSCTFKNNKASLGGAVALLTNRAFIFRNSTFNNNRADQAGAVASGGITAKLTVQNCTFASNIANQYGGAMAVPQNTTPIDIMNCTFANNQANNPVNGQSGAIHSGGNTPNNTVSIKNCLFANNTVTNTWGVWRDCNCILNDGGNNMFFPAGVSTNCVTTPNFINPLIGTLSDNGGPTQTIPILAGSPAINAGNGCPSTDQRGASRVGACDIGAFEFGTITSSCNLVVSSNADTGANTLREAISCATSGQTITFASTMANQTITLATTLEIPVNKNLIIDGIAASNLTISGNNMVRVFLLKSTSVQPTSLSLKNLRIINARTNEYGGGIKAEHQGTINLENCTFNNNRADDGGSAVCSAFEGYITIMNCNFDGNISIANNTERGSTVMIWGPYAHTIRNSNFTNNKGINGAAINGLNAGLLIENCSFIANITTDARFDTGKPNDFLRGFGGAIYTDRASQGSPSVVLGSIILRKCKFENNIGNGEGGACYLYTDETDNVLVEECYFNNNESKILTGGTNGGSGGAIQHMNNAKNRGFVVRKSTFSNNKAAVLGGAIRVDWADTEITNCTFDNNKALLTSSTGYSANGGALVFFSMANSFVDITNCTLANNYAGWTGGAVTSTHPTRTRIKNNIFFQNTAGNGGNTWNIQQHASAEMLDLGNNLQFPAKFTSNWNDYNVSSSVTIANPLLNAIANNGGFSPTMSLQATSPAINAGAGCSPSDQRGAGRVDNCDIGAFEFGGNVTSIINNITPKPLKIYPNPTADKKIFIEIPQNLIGKELQISIFNLQGKQIDTFKKVFIDIKSEIIFNNNISNGTYLLRITHNKESFSNKIIIN